METITLKIEKWADYNSKESLKTPHWFKVRTNIGSSRSLFGLTITTKWIWICLLSEAMNQRSGEFNLDVDWASQTWNVKKNDIKEAIESLKEKGILGADSEWTRSQLGVNSEPTRPRVEESRVEENIVASLKFDFEGLYGKYPRQIGKKKGIDICKRTILTEDSFQSLETAIKNYSDHVRRERTEPKFIKHFSTFMNCWTDWITVQTPKIMPTTPHDTRPVESPDPRTGPLPSNIKNLLDIARRRITETEPDGVA